jgi:hypothetical protein
MRWLFWHAPNSSISHFNCDEMYIVLHAGKVLYYRLQANKWAGELKIGIPTCAE